MRTVGVVKLLHTRARILGAAAAVAAHRNVGGAVDEDVGRLQDRVGEEPMLERSFCFSSRKEVSFGQGELALLSPGQHRTIVLAGIVLELEATSWFLALGYLPLSHAGEISHRRVAAENPHEFRVRRHG